MKNKNIIRITLLLFFLILHSFIALYITNAQCQLKEIPFFELNEGDIFNYTLNFVNQNISEKGLSEIKISLIKINSSINPVIKNNLINFKADQNSGNKNSFLIVSTMENGCYDVKKFDFFVYLKPKIMEKNPIEDYLEIYETQSIKFYASAYSFYDTDVKTEWYLNGIKQKESSNSYIFFTNYSSKGLFTLEYVAKDKRQNTTIKWLINVKDKNRKPILRFNIPDFVLTNYTRGRLLNLNDYFQDPDLDKLKFELVYFDKINNSIKEKSYEIFNFSIKDNGDFEVYPIKNIYLTEYLKVIAYDFQGEKAESNIFFMKLVNSDNISYIFLNTSKKEQCKPNIQCTEWSPCLITNIRTRECFDVNNCNSENTTITETMHCDYNATCNDGILNQGEEKVDCGGPCEPCPTCDDGILNQGEEKVDCGGPCNPCPSCIDNIQNQDETDVDCGGSCQKCEPEKKCLSHKDCSSFNCVNNICAYPTCFDNKLNQGEEKVDCGGPCKPCPTCNDGILNQGEEKVDCGGPCQACENCYDGIKNQNEIFTDCGGLCKSCLLLDIINFIKSYYYLAFIFIFLLIIKIYSKNISSSDKIKNYIFYSKLFNFLPKKIPENYKEIFTQTISDLTSIKNDILNLEDKE
ncbi:MAG: hypothetical protein QW757_04865, partial [Candidatus Woesearchaeota archaeon]